MAVYLDKLKFYWNERYWTHMVADSIDELHNFANNIGVKYSYFDENLKHPHYDINMMQVQVALINGAKFVDKRELIKISKKLSVEISSGRRQINLFD